MAYHLRLTPLAGAGKTTGGVWHVQYGRRGLLLDFGLDLARSGELLGPRLRIRATRGLLDPIQLGLLPRYVGLYRQDLLLDADLLEEADELNVEAIPLTHFHADHAANLYAVDPRIKIISTKITAAFANAHTVCATGLESEATLVAPRMPHETELGILRKPLGVHLIPREWGTVDGEPTEHMRELLRAAGSDAGIQEAESMVAGIPFQAYAVDHSLYGTCAYEFCPPGGGRVIFATDLRNFGRLSNQTEELVCHMERHRPDILLLDGTRLGRHNDVRTTERQAKARIRELVRVAGQHLVIAVVSANNLERLAAFNAAAEDTNRTLVVSPRTMMMIEAVQSTRPGFDLRLDGVGVYDPPMGSRLGWHRDLRERLDDRLVSLEQIRKDPRKYIFATSSQRRQDWIDLNPEHALLIYSASGAYSADARSEHSALRLWAEMYSMSVEGLSWPNGQSEVDPFLCASGHLHASDIAEICNRVRPRRLVGIHTDEPERFGELIDTRYTKLVIPENGRTIRLTE